jgi:hypothetical protein
VRTPHPARRQRPGQRAVPAAQIHDHAAALGGEAPGDRGMDVTAGDEAAGGGLVGGEAAGIGVVVAGRRLATDRRGPSRWGRGVSVIAGPTGRIRSTAGQD